jgi:ubiquitin carboxyl-terminal hydrolase L5
LQDCTDDTWLDVVAPHIQQRIQRYSQSEIRFNLMALVQSRTDFWQRKVTQTDQQMARLHNHIAALTAGGQPAGSGAERPDSR